MGEDSSLKFSVLLELSASNDLSRFKAAVEDEGLDIDQPSLWYGRKIGSKKMGFEERTPLMIAALFGSKDIADYIISSGRVDVNRACGSDGATALHCAMAGFSRNAAEIVRLLLNASADANSLDANGNRPSDVVVPVHSSVVIPRKKMVEGLLKGSCDLNALEEGREEREVSTPRVSEKKEYPVDPTLPDIKNGIYGTDEFRMYTFKIKPCSRAYSHDWTECPFVHPGENARRRDPRKYHYSCVPCPEFRKGSCSKGDACEYAHGIFESWLHPAQYRTRLCKDETTCSRRVCFFAHKPEELRPLYASTGSGVPSPRSSFSGCNSSLSFDVGSISPLAPGSPPAVIPPSSTPPLTPNAASSPVGGKMWMKQPNTIPPALQLHGSRLKSALRARDISFSDDIPGLSSLTSWNGSVSSASPFSSCWGDMNGNLSRLTGGMKATNLNDVFGPDDPLVMSQLQSPTGLQSRHSINQQLRASYPTSNSLSASPVGANSSFGIDSPAILSSRAAAFAKRSQSFIERSGLSQHSGISSPVAMTSTYIKDWGSPNGKLDWSVQGDELHKLRKSASFGIRNGGIRLLPSEPPIANEPDVSWVGPSVKESSEMRLGQYSFEQPYHPEYHLNSGGSEALPAWIEQSYTEPEQTVA